MFDSPYRSIALTVACGLGATVGLALCGWPAVYRSLPLLSGCFLFVVAGVVSMYWTAASLRDAVRSGRWPETMLVPTRRVVDHVLWKMLQGLLAVAMIAAAAAYWHHRNGLFWSVFFLLQTQTQIGGAFARPPEPRGTGSRLDWRRMGPVRSEHWGER